MLNKEQLKWFEDLTQLDGISGHERQIAAYLHHAYETVSDEIMYDQLGSIVALKKSKNPNAKKVLVLGHMDEIGFLVKEITDLGVLKLHPVGGWFDQTLLAQRIRLTTRHGSVYTGAIVSKPPHMLSEKERSKPVSISQMVADVGATSKQEIIDMGIQVGDSVVVAGPFDVLHSGKRLLSKAFDNRYGCVLGLDILNALRDKELDFDLYVGASVQEEVGLRGAQTLASMVRPDLAIILDCSPANDTQDKHAQGRLGDGVLLRVMDRSMIANKELLYRFQDTCAAHDISYQFYYSPGGTDAGIVHKIGNGIPTLTCCVVARSVHTSSSILDTDDYLAAREGLLHFLCEGSWGDVCA